MIKKEYSKSKPVCKVTFTLTSDQVGKKADVRVLGTFNDWSWDKGLAMKAKKKDYTASIELPAGETYEFRYLVNGQDWFNDESADDYSGTPFFSHNCIMVIDPVETKKAAPKAKATPKAKTTPKAKATAKKPAATKKTVTKKTSTARKLAPAKADLKAAAKAAPKPDDLKKIEGVGPKIAGLLQADGIHTFDDLAKAKPAQLKAILDAAGPRFKMHTPGSWPKQAKLAAAGKWDELKKLQDELKGGK